MAALRMSGRCETKPVSPFFTTEGILDNQNIRGGSDTPLMSEDNSFSDAGSTAPAGFDSFDSTQPDLSSATPAASDLQPTTNSYDPTPDSPTDMTGVEIQADNPSGTLAGADLQPNVDPSAPDQSDAYDAQPQADFSIGTPSASDYQPQPNPGAFVPPSPQRFDTQTYPDLSEGGNWWDKQAAPYKPGSFYLWFHVFCCQCPGILIALLLIMFCRTPAGKESGVRLLKYSLVGCVVGIGLRILIELLRSTTG
jgi:hypothetical protein